MSPTVAYLVALVVPLVLKTVMYIAIFRWRGHTVSLITCIVLAGSPLLLMIIPFPLPGPVVIIAGIGIALYILSRNTEIPLFPEGVAIICGVELAAGAVIRFMIL